MKKFILLAFFAFVGTYSFGQCSKSTASTGASCCAKKAAAATTSADATKIASFASAEEAAAADENIQEKVCSHSGKKTYYQKTANADGSVSWDEVAFCSTSKAFKKVAAASAERTVEAAQQAKSDAKPACCAGKKEGASCAKKEGTK